jgi:hypothetical protein
VKELREENLEKRERMEAPLPISRRSRDRPPDGLSQKRTDHQEKLRNQPRPAEKLSGQETTVNERETEESSRSITRLNDRLATQKKEPDCKQQHEQEDRWAKAENEKLEDHKKRNIRKDEGR